MSDTSERWFTVRSGNHTERTKARSPFLAAVAAVKTGKFQSLGWLISVRDEKIANEADGTFFVSSEKIVDAAGMWGAPPGLTKESK